MKKRTVRALICLLTLILPVFAAHAATVRLAPIGSAEEIFSKVSVYCNKWHDLIGSVLGYDMSFNMDRVKQTQGKHYDIGGNQVTSFDFDGISAEIGDDLTVYAMTIPILDGTKEKYTSTARIFAVLNALAFDFPSSDEEMSKRYMSCLSEYLDFMEKNKETLSAGEFAYWEVQTDKGEFEFQFISIDGRLRMIFDKLYFDD